MDNPYDQGTRSPEDFEPTYVRPPGLEFSMGVALFALIFMIFFLVQSLVFFLEVMERSPEFAGEPYSAEILTDPEFQQRMSYLIFNGDIVSLEALWSGGIGLLLILISVFIWKRSNAVVFLGMNLPRPIEFLKW